MSLRQRVDAIEGLGITCSATRAILHAFDGLAEKRAGQTGYHSNSCQECKREVAGWGDGVGGGGEGERKAATNNQYVPTENVSSCRKKVLINRKDFLLLQTDPRLELIELSPCSRRSVRQREMT